MSIIKKKATGVCLQVAEFTLQIRMFHFIFEIKRIRLNKIHQYIGFFFQSFRLSNVLKYLPSRLEHYVHYGQVTSLFISTCS